MIIRKTERIYKENKRLYMKRGLWDKEQVTLNVKRTTIWLLFIPICWWEKII